MHKLLRFFITVMTVVLLCCSTIITAFSATTVDYTLIDCITDNNRLFTISMIADCEKMLSAASFEFTYDTSMFEFRSAKVSDESSKITYNELENKVKLVFLNTEGIDINNGKGIFTLTFKAVKPGNGYIDFFVSDCVDSDINPIDAGKCTSAKIIVNSKSSKNSSGTSSSSDKTGKSESSGAKSERKKAEETISTYDEIGQLNSFDNQNTRFLIIGIAIGASIIAAAILTYQIINRIKLKRNKRNDSPDE